MSTPQSHRLLLGSCPDSWGVWFADDPLQTTVAGHSGLHKPAEFDSILAATRQVAELTAAMGARLGKPKPIAERTFRYLTGLGGAA